MRRQADLSLLSPVLYATLQDTVFPYIPVRDLARLMCACKHLRSNLGSDLKSWQAAAARLLGPGHPAMRSGVDASDVRGAISEQLLLTSNLEAGTCSWTVLEDAAYPSFSPTGSHVAVITRNEEQDPNHDEVSRGLDSDNSADGNDSCSQEPFCC